jgi:hypothetical protein
MQLSSMLLRILFTFVVFADVSSKHLASALISPKPLIKTGFANAFRSAFPYPQSAQTTTTRPLASLIRLHALFSAQAEPPKEGFDLIIVGSGNGACGFLSRYLDDAKDDVKILVLEQGKNFFYTSDLTHQYAWTRAYSEGNIFKLHNA